ncbi:MAG: type III-B CRISPR module RAMP protein Cmr6 [Bacteroidota bacterium]
MPYLNQSGPNLGWLYYKDYYWDHDTNKSILETPKAPKNDRRAQKAEKAFFQKKHRILLKEAVKRKMWIPNGPQYKHIRLKTEYPGLFSGSGYPHGTGRTGECKLGCFFDHSWGMPILPGSSVKGAIRSAFRHPDFLLEILSAIAPHVKERHLPALEAEIFGGEIHRLDGEINPLGVYQRDIFFDAVILHADLDGKILELDVITPHDPAGLAEPVPLLFLKVPAGVIWNFSFRFVENQNSPKLLSPESKVQLFTAILKFQGVGAKTRTGYGALSDNLELNL